MSRQGRSAAIVIATFRMKAGTAFERHAHHNHQLAWASSGVLIAHSGLVTWVLPSSRALWIPAHVTHALHSSGHTTMRTLYLNPAGCTISWREPTPVMAGPLLEEVVAHLQSQTLDKGQLKRAEAFLMDLLRPLTTATIGAPMPRDPRAHKVARALVENPTDRRSLDDWGRQVGASGRTIARAFLAETGLPFGQWRTISRLQSALPSLAAGEPVSRVAHQVGYDTASAFCAAFRRATGLSPGSYFTKSSR